MDVLKDIGFRMYHQVLCFLLVAVAGIMTSGLSGQVHVAYLHLDYNTKISINGVTELDREKYFNIHENNMDFESNYLR